MSTGADPKKRIVFFVNKSAPIQKISVGELQQIFLKKKLSWPSGEKIICVNTLEGSEIREIFREKVLKMTATEEQTYWYRQKIRRHLSAPPEFYNTPKAIFRLKNAIGYASPENVPKNVVKIVSVDM